MQRLGIAQEGDPILTTRARPFDLPREAEDARRAVAQLASTLERVAQTHSFSKGMGLAAPQIGIARAVALAAPAGRETITLINPRIIDTSTETDEQYEGCLSFFDYRGTVPRPLTIDVEHADINGQLHITTFEHATARLVAHEIDHLEGRLYRSRMRAGVEPIHVSQYTGTGRAWSYDPGDNAQTKQDSHDSVRLLGRTPDGPD